MKLTINYDETISDYSNNVYHAPIFNDLGKEVGAEVCSFFAAKNRRIQFTCGSHDDETTASFPSLEGLHSYLVNNCDYDKVPINLKWE